MENTRHGRKNGNGRKKKNTNPVEYRRLNNELRKETDTANEKFINETCDENTMLQQTGRYDRMYLKTKETEWKKNKGVQTFDTEYSEGHLQTNTDS